MPLTITMPALSPTMTEGRIARWLVKEGDSVAPGDVIAEIETDKATMELEADEEGVVGSIMVAEGGDAVPVNTPIAIILGDGESASAPAPAPPQVAPAPAPASDPAPAAAPAPAPAAQEQDKSAAAGSGGRIAASPAARRLAKEKGLELSAIQGSGPGGRIVITDVEAATAAAPAAAVSAAPPPSAVEPKVSPLAGRMAAQAGIDLATLAGSGAEGKIVKADIDAALAGGTEAGAASSTPTAAAPAPAAGDTEVPLSLMRKTIARRLTESKQTVPHFTQIVECDIERLNELLEELNGREGAAYKLTINDFLVRALALALKAQPEVNASWGETVMLQHNSVDVAVAVATEGGLITPIVRQADRMGLAEISAAVRELAGRARQGKLAPEEYQGGSFTISNLGMFGITEFSAIINPPQSGIVAVGVGQQRPLVRDGALAIATLMTCTFSFDHRVVDGVLGAHFANAFKGFVEDPLSMLL